MEEVKGESLLDEDVVEGNAEQKLCWDLLSDFWILTVLQVAASYHHSNARQGPSVKNNTLTLPRCY